MNDLLYASGILCVASLLNNLAYAGQTLNILLEPYPPFAFEHNGQVSGPYAEAFRQQAQAQGLQLNFELAPIRRALLILEKQPVTCLLAVHYAPAMAEVTRYLGRVAPLYLWAYSRVGEIGPISQLSALRGRQIAGIELPELREATDAAGISYERLVDNSKGYQMLVRRRFDILLSDIGPQLLSQEQGLPLNRLLLVARGERWLACHRSVPAPVLDQLRLSIKEGLFAESSKAIWEKHKLGDYYQQVRKEWLPAAKASP